LDVGTQKPLVAPRFVGSRTQNYFPTFDYVRSSTISAAELGFCRLSWRAADCRSWPFCGLVADWLRTKIACVAAFHPRGTRLPLPTRISMPPAAQAPEGRSASLRDGPPAHPSPAAPQPDRSGLRGAGRGCGTGTRSPCSGPGARLQGRAHIESAVRSWDVSHSREFVGAAKARVQSDWSKIGSLVGRRSTKRTLSERQ
jgi:hypothetical protein